MTPTELYGLVAVAILSLALYTLIASHDLLRRIIAANVMGSAVFLLFVSLSYRGAEPDPVPHAMVLTGIVVAVAATGLAVVLVRRMHADGASELPEDRGDRSDR